MSGRWVPGLTPRPVTSDVGSESDLPSAPARSVNDRLARLRQETRRHALNKLQRLGPRTTPNPVPARQHSHPGYLFLDQQSESSGSNSYNRGQRRVAGPPPPSSWKSAFALFPQPSHTAQDGNNLDLVVSVWDSPYSEQLVARRKEIKGLIQVDEAKNSNKARGRGRRGPLSLLETCLLVVASDPAPYAQLIPLVPLHLILRAIELASIYSPLSDSSIRHLLLPDTGDDGSQSRSIQQRLPEPDEEGREENSSWEDLVVVDNDTLGLDSVLFSDALWSFSSLSTLDLCFSSITLATLRTLLYIPGSNVPRLPSLRTLLLAHTPNLPLSPALLSLFPRLTSLHSLSLAHKKAPTYPSRVFISRLAAATPLLRKVDLGYSEWMLSIDDLDGVDWSTRWTRLESIVLRGCQFDILDGGGDKKLVQQIVMAHLRDRGRTAWLQVER
jgi:hypothetical protein